MADKPMHVELKGGPGAHEVDILFDGERPDWWIESIAITATGGDIVKAVITIGLTEADVDLDGARVSLHEDQALLLKRLGWTPPSGAV